MSRTAIVVFTSAFLLLSLGVGAAEMDTYANVTVEDVDEDMLQSAAETYNTQYASQLPGIVSSLVQDERVNVHINTSEEVIVYGAALDGVNISQIEKGGVGNETLRVYTSTETIETIVAADNPRDRAVTAFKSDEIRYEAVGLLRQLKFGIVSFFITLLG